MAKKPPTYEPIGEDERPDLYALVRGLVSDYHEELEPAVIQLVWRRGWKPDKDARLVLGQAVIPSREDRLTHGIDLRIRLSFEAFQSDDFTEAMRKALIDHELRHFAAVIDEESGEQKVGADGLLEWRIRKHDLEEHACIVERHGMWKGDIVSFVEKALAAGVPEQMSLSVRQAVRDSGVTSVAFGTGPGATTITRGDLKPH